jgi:DNA anti-recombination protein RmuC
MGVAQLIRADSEALRQLIEDRTDVQVETIRETVDWRMAAFAERIDEKLGSIATEVASSLNETVASSLASSLSSTPGSIEGLDEMLAEGQAGIEERMRAHIDDRMTAIARLIRSDNQALASAVREQQPITPSEPLDAELVRQTLRAIKELQAGLAEDVQTRVDANLRSISDQLHQETQSTTESMVKVAEVLGEKIDRLSVRVDEGVGNDMQVVIDRMTDAIQAMSATRRSA